MRELQEAQHIANYCNLSQNDDDEQHMDVIDVEGVESNRDDIQSMVKDCLQLNIAPNNYLQSNKFSSKTFSIERILCKNL